MSVVGWGSMGVGALVLGEAENAPLWVVVVFVIAGAIAVWGVFGLARYHPQVISDSQEIAIRRGSGGPSTGSRTQPPTGNDPPGQ